MKIKFKAITTDGKWVEGFLLPNNILRQTFKNKDADGRDYDEVISDYKIIPETVCVGVLVKNEWYYTGDKATISYGKMKHPPTPNRIRNGVIVFEDGQLSVKVDDSEVRVNFSIINEIEITGSIHDKHLKG